MKNYTERAIRDKRKEYRAASDIIRRHMSGEAIRGILEIFPFAVVLRKPIFMRLLWNERFVRENIWSF